MHHVPSEVIITDEAAAAGAGLRNAGTLAPLIGGAQLKTPPQSLEMASLVFLSTL